MSESTATKTDCLYFKYKPINKYLIESLVGSNLYFSRPRELNDPFDCRIDLKAAMARAAARASGQTKEFLESLIVHGEEFVTSWIREVEKFAVCSFSLDMTHPEATLLWSHYADRHRGVCLLYRFPEAFLLDPKNKVLGTDKVYYDEDRITDGLRAIVQPELKEFVIELVKLYLTSKSPAWHYEHEARIIRKAEDGMLTIPRGFLEQVTFGLDTPQADIDLVHKLARDYCGCKQFCKIVRTDSDYGIDAINI